MKERRLLIFFVDAFAYEYLQQVNFLSELAVKRCSLNTLLGEQLQPIIPAIWSGKYPDETGIFGLNFIIIRKNTTP